MRPAEHSFAIVTALAAAPVMLGMLAVRPSWRVGLRERLGRYSPEAPGAVWIHAASVGEIRAASSLVDRLKHSGKDVFTSTFTLSGREFMRRTRPELPCQLAPVDHPWCVESALERVRPAALVLVETEIWPSWIAAAERRGVPVLSVSGCISDRSFERYLRLGRIVGRTLRRLEAIGARTAQDAERFRALGADPARVSVMGDLKMDCDMQIQALAPDLDRVLGGSALFVAGSTHPGEERAALGALDAVEQAGLEATLILAPRHTKRIRAVERAVRETGRRFRRRSALGDTKIARGEVLIVDTLGELASLYSLADVAFVGGSLVPVGGHNVLEPVIAGRPVIYGPHTENVSHAIEILSECGAGRGVADAAELGRAVVEVLASPASARERAQRGQQLLLCQRGSSQRAGALIEAALASAAKPATVSRGTFGSPARWRAAGKRTP